MNKNHTKNSKAAAHNNSARRNSRNSAQNLSRTSAASARKNVRNARPAGNEQRQRQPVSSQQRSRISNEQQRMTNRAYNQATVNRTQKRRKRGSRGKNYFFYYLIAIILAVIVLIVLANTVLFRCSSIVVTGNSRYTAEQIISPSGLTTGQNLLHIDTKDAENKISAALAYVDSVSVKRSLPTKIVIDITEAEKWFLISDNGVTGAVSRLGRIIEIGTSDELPLVTGYEPAEITPGADLESVEAGKNGIPSAILEKAEQYGITDIVQIDVTDRFDIIVECGNNITLQLGGISDIDGKLSRAAATMELETSDVTINLRSTEKISVRDKVNEQPQQPQVSEDSSEITEEVVSEEALSNN